MAYIILHIKTKLCNLSNTLKSFVYIYIGLVTITNDLKLLITKNMQLPKAKKIKNLGQRLKINLGQILPQELEEGRIF